MFLGVARRLELSPCNTAGCKTPPPPPHRLTHSMVHDKNASVHTDRSTIPRHHQAKHERPAACEKYVSLRLRLPCRHEWSGIQITKPKQMNGFLVYHTCPNTLGQSIRRPPSTTLQRTQRQSVRSVRHETPHYSEVHARTPLLHVTYVAVAMCNLVTRLYLQRGRTFTPALDRGGSGSPKRRNLIPWSE